MTLKVDSEAVQEWIYPLNKPRRDYQFNIVKKCLFDNTLVALPTGLGKTFIAGVIMLNCGYFASPTIVIVFVTRPPIYGVDYRWFPEGKIVFMAPTKPLVAQQIEASHQSCGIPGSAAAELSGDIPMQTRIRAVSVHDIRVSIPAHLTRSRIVCREASVLLYASNFH